MQKTSEIVERQHRVSVIFLPEFNILALSLGRIGFPKTIYYMRHFQAKHNVDAAYLNILDPDLTEYGFGQGATTKFNDDKLELVICSPLSRTIQTYLSLFNNSKRRDQIPFKLDADLQVRNYRS
jgi:broad specificity phosphatase PhoE